jgi:hypothetical protein
VPGDDRPRARRPITERADRNFPDAQISPLGLDGSSSARW